MKERLGSRACVCHCLGGPRGPATLTRSVLGQLLGSVVLCGQRAVGSSTAACGVQPLSRLRVGCGVWGVGSVAVSKAAAAKGPSSAL